MAPTDGWGPRVLAVGRAFRCSLRGSSGVGAGRSRRISIAGERGRAGAAVRVPSEAAEQADEADEGRLEPGRGMEDVVLRGRAQVVSRPRRWRPSQLIRSVRRTPG